MHEVPFTIRNHLYNSTEEPTAVQLYGGPLGMIVSITVYKNELDDGDVDGGTSGQLPKKNELAYITASQARFAELCAGIDGGGNCVLYIAYEVIDGKRCVQDVWLQVTVLQQISDNTGRAADMTEQILEVVSGRFDQLLSEVGRTNDLLRERLPQPGSMLPHAATPSDIPPHDTTNGGKH